MSWTAESSGAAVRAEINFIERLLAMELAGVGSMLSAQRSIFE
jgi:hypothetical protein